VIRSEWRFDGIVVSNTTLSRDWSGTGASPPSREDCPEARSRPRHPRACRIYQLTEGRLPLIGVGGIDGGATALAKIDAGASLLQLYTGLVFEVPKLIGGIKQALVEAMEKAKASSLAPLIGRDADKWADRRL
jgi:dihydroorotate dehydrogenase